MIRLHETVVVTIIDKMHNLCKLLLKSRLQYSKIRSSMIIGIYKFEILYRLISYLQSIKNFWKNSNISVMKKLNIGSIVHLQQCKYIAYAFTCLNCSCIMCSQEILNHSLCPQRWHHNICRQILNQGNLMVQLHHDLSQNQTQQDGINFTGWCHIFSCTAY